MKAIVAALAVTFSTLAFSAPALAADKEQARAAYDRGLEAYKRGDKQQAAEEFALADSLAPSAVALRAAIDAAIEANDPALGNDLVERSRREPAPPSLAARIREANLKFKGRAGRVRIVCPVGSTCSAKIEERAVETDKIVWTHTGQRSVVAQVDGSPVLKTVDVSADGIAEVTLAKGGAPEGEPAQVGSTERGTSTTPSMKALPPFYFYAGAGVTAVLAGMTMYFAIDTSSTHGDFEDAGCARVDSASCRQLASDGEGAQTRTNVSLVLMLLTGAATAVVGVKFTDWKAPIVSVHPNGTMVGWAAKF